MSGPITSTPVPQKRTSFIPPSPATFFPNQNDVSVLNASSLRRKRNIEQVEATPAQQHQHGPADDEEERSKRRIVVDLQKKSATATGQLSFLESVKLLGEREIKEQIQLCSKLYNENKINANNAWRIQIIDILNQLSKKDSADTLHLASKSLDISSRVYSVRVDDAHSHGITLASNIARMSSQPSADNAGNIDGESADGDGGGAVKKGRKRNLKRQRRSLLLLSGEKLTVAKDKATNLGKLDMLDSVIFSARTRPELSAIDNLFTNSLHMDQTSTRFELLSNEKYWCDGDDVTLNAQAVQNFMQGVNLNSPRLGSCLQDFCVDEWNPDDEKELNESSEQNDRLVLDDKGNPIPELDGSVNDIFADNLPDEVYSDHSDDVILQPVAMQAVVPPIETFIDTKNPDLCEYTYNPVIVTQSGKAMEQIWAGPSHWKLKCIRRARARYLGKRIDSEDANGDGRKKRALHKKAEVNAMEFVSESGSSSDEEGVVQQRLGGANRGRNSMLIERRMKIIKVKKNSHTTKPKNLNVPILDDMVKRWERDYQFLQLTDCVEVTRKGEGEEAVGEGKDEKGGTIGEKEEEVKEENDSDGSIFGGGDNDVEDVPNNEDTINTAFPTNSQNTAHFLGDNLIDMPEMVNKVSINFATTAKRMDMKKLKDAVWRIVTKSCTTQSKKKPVKFSEVYKQLPNLITKRMREGLSVHLALFSVLHLANDHNLQLEGQSDCRNFTIKLDND